jgi:hypothetical protein
MIIDSSAILAVIGKEPGYERIVHELAASSGIWIGAPTRLESGIVLTARFGLGGRRPWHGSCRRTPSRPWPSMTRMRAWHSTPTPVSARAGIPPR